MVCCVMIAALLGLILRPVAGRRASPLTWRPDRTDAAAEVSWAGGRLRSFTFAFAGIGFLLRAEPNMRLHLAASVAVVLAGVWLQVDVSDWRWIVAAITMVLTTEALNTGVEQACNAFCLEYRTEIKAAKDVAAAAVLIAAFAALLIGASVFGPYLLGARHTHISFVCGG